MKKISIENDIMLGIRYKFRLAHEKSRENKIDGNWKQIFLSLLDDLYEIFRIHILIHIFCN